MRTFLKRSIVSKLSQFLGPAPPTHLRGRGWPAVRIHNFFFTGNGLESLDLRQAQCRVLFPASLASHLAGANCQGAENPQDLPNHARIRVTFFWRAHKDEWKRYFRVNARIYLNDALQIDDQNTLFYAARKVSIIRCVAISISL